MKILSELESPQGKEYIIESDEKIKYHVQPKTLTCTCPNHIHRSSPKFSHICKHLAHVLVN